MTGETELGGALAASPVQCDLVVVDDEAGRQRHLRKVTWTAMHVEDAIAGPALEVMVVAVFRQLVPRALQREGHGADRTLVDQRPDGSVDGGNPKTWGPRPGSLEDFLRRKRPARKGDSLADGGTLLGGSLHHDNDKSLS